MKLPYTACLVLLALTAGCVQVEQTLILNADGSGVMEFSYGLSQEHAQQLADAVNTAQQMEQEGATGEVPAAATAESPLEFNVADIRRDFKEFEPYGVALESVRSETRDGWRFIHLKIAFKSLEGLSKTSMVSDRAFSLTRNADGNYILSQLSGSRPPAPETPGADAAGMEAMVRDLMKGFRVAVNVKTPGKILATNAHRHQGDTATWEFDLEKDPQAVDRAGQLDMQVTFAGDGLNMQDFRWPGPDAM